MATAKKSTKSKVVTAKTVPPRSAGKHTREESVWVRLGAVTFTLLAVAFLLMVLSKYL